MNINEKMLRNQVADRVAKMYPDSNCNFQKFRDGEYKPSIDSWLGDAFAQVIRLYNLKDYDLYRKLLFCD